MSFNTLVVQQQDQTLMGRVRACAQQLAWSDTTTGTSAFGIAVRNAQVDPAMVLGWPVCVATEQEYASALAGNVANPGGDPSVIGDDEITAAVQKAWPPQWPPVGASGTLAPLGPPVAPMSIAPATPLTPPEQPS